MSGLTVTEKQLLRVASFEASWLAGNAIGEASRMKKSDIYNEIMNNFRGIVITLDLEELATRCVLVPVRESHESLFKRLLNQSVKEGEFQFETKNITFSCLYSAHIFIGKTVWEKYKNLKSLLLNHENPHFHYKSGDNLDDALDRAKNNLLLYKQNKNIMSANKRKATQDPMYIIVPLLTLDDVEVVFFLPEHLIFKGHYDKPIFTVPRQTKSCTYSDSDEEGTVLRDSEARKTSTPKKHHMSAVL